MRRRLNWDVRLTEWAIDQVGRPFVWGETDCVALLRAALEVMYGEPLGPDLPPYTTLAAALELSRRYRVRDELTALGAYPLAMIPYAHTGDVLIASPRPGEPFELTMVVVTDRMLVTEPDALVQLFPVRAAPIEADAYRLPHAG